MTDRALSVVKDGEFKDGDSLSHLSAYRASLSNRALPFETLLESVAAWQTCMGTNERRNPINASIINFFIIREFYERLFVYSFIVKFILVFYEVTSTRSFLVLYSIQLP